MYQNQNFLWEVVLYIGTGSMLAGAIAFFPKRWLRKWVKVTWLSPNAITAYGLLLTWAGTALYVNGYASLTSFWLIVAGRSLDRFDGKMAAVRDQARKEARLRNDPDWEQFPEGSTELGKVLDPIADKLGWIPFIIGFARHDWPSLILACFMTLGEVASTLLRPLPKELEEKLIQGKLAWVIKLFSLSRFSRRSGATWVGKVKYAFQVFYVLVNLPMDRGWFNSPLWLLWGLLGTGTLLSIASSISRLSLTPELNAQIDEDTEIAFGHGETDD